MKRGTMRDSNLNAFLDEIFSRGAKRRRLCCLDPCGQVRPPLERPSGGRPDSGSSGASPERPRPPSGPGEGGTGVPGAGQKPPECWAGNNYCGTGVPGTGQGPPAGPPAGPGEGPECWAGNNYCGTGVPGTGQGSPAVSTNPCPGGSGSYNGEGHNWYCSDGTIMPATHERPNAEPCTTIHRGVYTTGTMVGGVCQPDGSEGPGVTSPAGPSVPPFIEWLFPVGTSINYVDGGTTSVVLPGRTSPCRFTADDIFILLMIKESHPDQSGIVWNRGMVTVTKRNGDVLEIPMVELEELKTAYHSFWDTESVAALKELAEQGVDPFDTGVDLVDGLDPEIIINPGIKNDWLKDTPLGYRMVFYAFSAAETAMNGVLGKGGVLKNTTKVTGTGPLHWIGQFALQFINWDPNPEGRPGQGKAAFFDKDGVQVFSMAEAQIKMAHGEIVYLVDSFGGDPVVLNYEQQGVEVAVGGGGFFPWQEQEKLTIGPITDFGTFYGKLELKHPTPRTPSHPDTFSCS